MAMLHHINPPTCAPQFDEIVCFQRHVLAFACDAATTLPLTIEQCQTWFNNDIGSWLWEKLWTNRRSGQRVHSPFHKALEKLIRYVTRRTTLRSQILDAFDHDITFHQNLNNVTFEFWYRTRLSAAAQKAVRGLMQAFYTDLLSSGFPSGIHTLTHNIDRDALIAAFWAANPKLEVCPACDSAREDTIDTKIYADADHYLPKAKYPFLSVHPANLVPLCIACNRTFKGDRDPLDKGVAALTHNFHPYTNPAVGHITVQVTRTKGVPVVQIADNAGMPSRRVANLNRVFRLEERWPDRLRYQINELREGLAGRGRRMMQKGIVPTDVDLKDDLQDLLQARVDAPGQKHNSLLQIGYLTYALNDIDEFAEFFAQYVGA